MAKRPAGRAGRFDRDRLTPRWAEPPRLYLRWVLGIALATVAGGAGFVLMLVGTITTSGCFFGCSDPNYLIGIPALIATGALASVCLGALWWGFVDRGWRRAGPSLAWTAVAGTAILILLSFNARS